MATSHSGSAAICARELQDCPVEKGCPGCRSRGPSWCHYPYRPGKTNRDKLSRIKRRKEDAES